MSDEVSVSPEDGVVRALILLKVWIHSAGENKELEGDLKYIEGALLSLWVLYCPLNRKNEELEGKLASLSKALGVQ